MSELPSEWTTIRLGDVSEHITKGATPTTYGYGWVDDGILFLRSECVTERGFSALGSEHISPEAHESMARSAIMAGDLLMTITGYIGRTCRYPKDMPEANINQHIARIRVSDEEKLDSSYALWALKDPKQLKSLELEVTGLAYPQIGLLQVQNISVPAPPVVEQRRIAEILDTLDEAIQKTEQLIAKLKQIKQGLLHDLLTRGIDENGQLRDPIAHPEQFKDSVLGRMPKEWDVPQIRDIAVHVGSGVTPRGGSEVYRSEGVLFLRSQNIHFDGLHLDDVAYIDSRTHEQMSRSEVFPHDVLINITGASIGRCCAVPKGIGPTNVNQHVCAIRTAEPRKEDAKYLASVLTSYIGQSQIDRLNAGGNREGLNYEQLRSFSVPWPRQDERKRIAEVISAHDKHLSDEEEYLKKLGLEKKGLMHDLLTGKVRVKDKIKEGSAA